MDQVYNVLAWKYRGSLEICGHEFTLVSVSVDSHRAVSMTRQRTVMLLSMMKRVMAREVRGSRAYIRK